MKKFTMLCAAVAACMMSLTSCEKLFEALPINYWFCGSECIIAKADAAEVESGDFLGVELVSITLKPKADAPEGVSYGLLLERDRFNKAIQGQEIPLSGLWVISTNLKGKDYYISGTGDLVYAFGIYNDEYKFAKDKVTGSAKLSLNSSNYLTLTVDYKAVATAKYNKDTDSYEDLPEDKQFELNISSHYAGTATVKL